MSPDIQPCAVPADSMYVFDTSERDSKAALVKSLTEFDNKPEHLSVLQLTSCISTPLKTNGEESKQPIKQASLTSEV